VGCCVVVITVVVVVGMNGVVVVKGVTNQITNYKSFTKMIVLNMLFYMKH
jgi:hypothetical protein